MPRRTVTQCPAPPTRGIVIPPTSGGALGGVAQDAELVPLGVSQDDLPCAWAVLPAVVGELDRPALQQSGEFGVAPTLDGLQVQMQAVLDRLRFRYLPLTDTP